MKTKNIFKTLAAAMLLPAMLLTTACSSEDDFAGNENTENVAKKGFTLPVTVSVTRQGDDATTRATFNGETKKLEFSTGDKLFVNGGDETVGAFAGTLDYVSDGTFSGTITIEKEYSGTVDELFAQGDATAILLPAGYEDYGYWSIDDNGTSDAGYDDYFSPTEVNAFATSKAIAVEQFSREGGEYTSGSGFALSPQNAILNFTISGLAKNTEVTVVFTMWGKEISRRVETDDSGTATFAIGIYGDSTWNNENFSLTVGGNAITLVSSSKTLTAGKIYNINRSAAPAVTTATPLTMEALTDGTIVVNMGSGTLSTGMQYTVNGGEKTKITTTTTIDGLKAGDKVQFYGVGTDTQAYGDSPEVKIAGGTAKVKVYGNIMSLVDEENFATKTDLPNKQYVFFGLFKDNKTLTDASGLLLPATTLAEHCYSQMFYGCWALTAAPALPATTLAGYCYYYMFYTCSALTDAPALPATTLAEYCYYYMFYHCSALTAAPELPATTLAMYCYNSMFQDCSALASVTCRATDISAYYCLSDWLQNAGTTATSPTLYVDPTMTENTGWNNAGFTIKAIARRMTPGHAERHATRRAAPHATAHGRPPSFLSRPLSAQSEAQKF